MSAGITSNSLYSILGIVGSILILIMFLLIAVSVLVAWRLSHPRRLRLDASPDQYGLDFQSISFLSRDQEVQLKGWFLPAKTDRPKMTLIFSHGYSSNRLEANLPALSLTKEFVDHGYNVMLYDFRSCGESGGNITSVGLLEKEDLLGAIDWVRSHHNEPIGLVGFSMGAATSLVTAAEVPDVLGVVSDSSFSQLSEYLSDNLSVWSKLPKFPFTKLILLNLQWILGMSPTQVNPLLAVDRIYPRPILFIHGDEDKAIPHLNSVQMQQKHPDAFRLWITADAGHVESYAKHKDEYTRRVVEFFDVYLSKK